MRALAVAVILLAGCAGAARRPPAAKPAQGIRGRVVKLVGDFTMDPPRGESVPQSVPVHVFRGRVKPLDAPDPKHPRLVRIVKPGGDGRFELALPPGEYTLVAEVDGKLYLNSWADDGCWTPVIVRAGRWTEFVIENVLEATF